MKVENKENFNAQEALMKKAIKDFETKNKTLKENESLNNHKILKNKSNKKDGKKTGILEIFKKLFNN